MSIVWAPMAGDAKRNTHYYFIIENNESLYCVVARIIFSLDILFLFIKRPLHLLVYKLYPI